MDSVDIEVLRTAEAWRKQGRPVALGTIVKTWGSAPRPVGAMVAIRDDGQVVGSVSGGCVEDDLIDKVKARVVAASKPELVTYGVTNEEATRWGLPCGGTLQLVLEPLTDHSRIAELLDRISQQQLVKRRLEMDSGRATLEPGRWQDVLEFDGKVLSAVHGPRWRLVLIGAGQLTRYLAEMAHMLDYHVSVIDPREEYANGWNLAGVPLNRGMPDDVVRELNLDGHSAIVALTHDPKLDDLALMEALKSAAFYVGAIGLRSQDGDLKNIVGLLLAAGSAKRFGSDKLQHSLPHGVSIAVQAARHLKSELDRVIAVTRPGADELAAKLRKEGCEVTVCENAAEGMGASLACAARAAGQADGYLVALGDMPFVRRTSIAAVRAAVADGAALAAPYFRARRGHPVGMAGSFYAELLRLRGDEGAKRLLAAHENRLVKIPVGDPGVVRDIDTRDDLAPPLRI